jgi:hypothetical protein
MYSRITCELTVVFGRFLRFPSFVIKTGFQEFGHRFPNFLVSWFLWVSAGFCGFLRWRNPWKLKCLNTDVRLPHYRAYKQARPLQCLPPDSTYQSPTESCRTHRNPEESPGTLRNPQESSGILRTPAGLHYDFEF